MKPKDGRTTSAWIVAASVPAYPPVTADAACDVCVVGAGIAGLTTAYLLATEGKDVIVVDYGPIGEGQTGRTSAHLTNAFDDRFYEIRSGYDEATSRVIYESHTMAIDTIERIARQEKIECDLERLDGYLFINPEHPQDLERELAAAQLAGFKDVELLDRPQLDGMNHAGPCLRFPQQGRFHPLKYLAGLCRALEKLKVKIHCGTRINEVKGGDLDKNELCEARSDDGKTIRARAIVVATNTPAPITDWIGIYTKQASYRTYMIGIKVPRGSVSDALYWDTGHPYHYVRVESSSGDEANDILLVGGEDHKVGQFDEGAAPFAQLEKWAREHFPSVGDIKFRWSGQVQEPADGIAFIGRAPTQKPNVYVITGDSGQGLTHATLGAILVSDQIMGRTNPWEAVYDPARKVTGAIGEFISENVNAAKTFVDYVTPGDIKSVDELSPGAGAIMRQGMTKLAVFRDEQGQVHKCSAVCTHLGCLVQWNHVEQSWDCPCHGSRFDAYGKVVMGPTVRDLERTDE